MVIRGPLFICFCLIKESPFWKFKFIIYEEAGQSCGGWQPFLLAYRVSAEPFCSVRQTSERLERLIRTLIAVLRFFFRELRIVFVEREREGSRQDKT